MFRYKQQCINALETHQKNLPFGMILFAFKFEKKSCYHQGFFAVKRRAVFILGAKWKALVRGWRRDCVVSGMETRFQWRKAHSRTAKCKAFHVAPRLFFMFLSLVPFTIRQQCITFPLKYRVPTIQNRFWAVVKKKKWVRPIFHWGHTHFLVILLA